MFRAQEVWTRGDGSFGILMVGFFRLRDVGVDEGVAAFYMGVCSIG